MKKILLILFLFISINSFGQIDSLITILKSDIETVSLCNVLTEIKYNLDKVAVNLGDYSHINSWDDPTNYLRGLNRLIRDFNEKYANRVIKGIKIPKLRTYKLILTQIE